MSDTNIEGAALTERQSIEEIENNCHEIMAELCFLSYEPKSGVLSEGQLLRLASSVDTLQATGIILGIKPSILYENENNLSISSGAQLSIISTYLSRYSFDSNYFRNYVSNTIEQWTNSINTIYDVACTAFPLAEEFSSYEGAKSSIRLYQLREWLEKKGIHTDFFNMEEKIDAPYINSSHPRFSPKLYAAIKAWEAMEDENLYRGISAKKGMEDWLKSNYKSLGLAHANGEINKTAIDEAAKIANWMPLGGAPKTPE